MAQKSVLNMIQNNSSIFSLLLSVGKKMMKPINKGIDKHNTSYAIKNTADYSEANCQIDVFSVHLMVAIYSKPSPQLF